MYVKLNDNLCLNALLTPTCLTNSTFTSKIVCVWNIKHEKTTDFTLRECLRGHTDSITVLTASRPFSLILSGSLVCVLSEAAHE